MKNGDVIIKIGILIVKIGELMIKIGILQSRWEGKHKGRWICAWEILVSP